ncbi:hypothetical protein EES43_19445 [Streptomyces sp. ADI96-02]|uniref:hypothetical protein n=1 Tax=unclassified Streptomyces TaxID=2593676 RepID=UPI000F5550A0|nr:hypothetical protein [Streptomyces sp. ADI96-02]RPK58696.1 hypothetical protein EES43_19445 [Streptomyces sp. ADI96-02]
MRIFKKNTLTSAVGLTTTAVASLVLTAPGTAQAAPVPAAWSVDCDKWTAPNDPGANDMVASIWRSNDSTKAARASFKGSSEKLSISNWSGAMMGYQLQWTTANGSTIEKNWELDLGSGKSDEIDFNIPDGRTVYLSVGTPGGSTAYCTGKA